MLTKQINSNNKYSETLAQMEAQLQDHKDFVKFMQEEYAAYNALTNVEPELEVIRK